MSTTAADADAPPESTTRHKRILERARQREEPTRTRTIRKRYAQRLRGRWDAIRAAMREGIVKNNALALRTEALVDPPGRREYDFPTDAEKSAGFKRWVDRAVEREILREFGEENDFVKHAYERGVEDAHTELRALGIREGAVATTSVELPVHKETLRTLYARHFRALEGMTSETGREMSRVLSSGLAAGDSPRDIADDVADRIEAVGKTRADVIARTEVMRAHGHARLREWERAGVRQVGVLIASDACPVCQAYKAGEPYPAESAYSNLPKHPNCRCSHHVWTDS